MLCDDAVNRAASHSQRASRQTSGNNRPLCFSYLLSPIELWPVAVVSQCRHRKTTVHVRAKNSNGTTVGFCTAISAPGCIYAATRNRLQPKSTAGPGSASYYIVRAVDVLQEN